LSNEVFIQDNNQSILTNATVTSNNSAIVTGYGFQQVSIVVNIKASPTGTTPTLTFTIQEVDPGDKTTTFGNSASTQSINAIGVYTASLSTTTSGTIKVSWTITGAGASFTQVYATVVAKATPTSQATSTSPSNSTFGFVAGEIVLATTTISAVTATTYTEPSSNAQRSVASSSASDTSAGTGARTIKITYYSSSAGVITGPFTETITLNGTSNVNTVSTTICFIEKIEVLTVGSNGSPVGTISLFGSTGGAGGTVWSIAVGLNRTLGGHHYVPTNKTCNITTFLGGIKGADTSGFYLKSKDPTNANSAEVQVTTTMRAPSSGGTPVRIFGTPLQIIGPARVTAYALPDSSSSRTYYASFDFYEQ
jgi:hypothetical protein